ncbi:hypothetical protein J4E91_008578 [Alternaria rosae]|nr:hypothetical protein J4E91_008578 [Alternaria rosae]
MSASRYPENGRYPRDRSPPYRDRDRRPSNFSSGYPPRGNETFRPNAESGGFSREVPKGPKSLSDAPRGPPVGPPSSASAAPRDDRGRGFAGRGEATPLRTAPPLSSGPGFPHNSQNSWRADRDRDRDFDRRERRPTPPRRSPIRDSRDPRDQRDFGPRELDVSRARRNSREGPPSAGSTYSDPPPPGTASSYRGGGIGRGRGGFAGRGRNFHNDDRDRHHDSRDRIPERTYRPRSRTPPRRQERDIREDRDFDRRERDDRRFPREYDSYIGPAGAAKPGLRALDTHRGPGPSDLRHLPGTPTGPTPHSSHHASPSDRLGPQGDTYSRRSSVAIDPLSAKDPRREPGKDEALLASRAEASRERYAPRASSPPASIPAFGGSNVWRAPISDNKPSAVTVAPTKSAQPTPAPTTNTSVGPVTPAAPVTPVKAAVIPTAPKATILQGLSTLPPTGPKADRAPDRPLLGDVPKQENRAAHPAPTRMEPPSIPPTVVPSQATDASGSDNVAAKVPISPQMAAPPKVPSMAPSAPPTAPTAPSGAAKSPPQGPAARPRPPPTAPQAARVNVSPSFSRATLPQYTPRDASPSANPSGFGPRSGGGGGSAINTSPQSLPANIPTGPKADRTPMAPRPLSSYPQSDRPGFPPTRGPLSGGPKSMQWVRPGFNSSRPSVPTKREFPAEDRERPFGTVPKAPRLEHSVSAAQIQRNSQAKSVSPSFSRIQTETERPRERAVSAERPVVPSPKPTPIETRRHSDVVMAEASPRMAKPPMSAASSAPEALQDSDDDLDLDEDDFAESEAKYNRERARLEAKRVDLSAPHLRATTPLQEIVLLSCLNVEHLPQTQPDVVSVEETSTPFPQEQEESHFSPVQVRPVEPAVTQAAPESITADLPTPKAEESEDVEMEDKEETKERSAAPATMALRLRRENSADQETLPDLSSLPYLGSGPPTPLSDIGQDRPNLSNDIMNAIRSKLRKSIEPELNTDQILERYAATYRAWRVSIRPLDEERDQDDQDRQPSAEPTLKAVTPDVQNAAMTGILDGSLAPTGRRSHASRWATELDLEAVIKESLKTAEEEKLGKKDKEPRKAMADPEKEADLPLELTEAEAQRRRFIDTNFQREPGQGIFVFHYEPPEDDFTPEEHRVMVHNYKDQYAKKWGKLAEVLYKEVGTERTYKDCINHYYATKWGREYKGKLRKARAPRKRGGAVGRGRGAIANMDRPEGPGEDGLPLPVTETGRPRRHAAPKFGPTETEFDPITGIPIPGRARRQTDADDTQEKAMRRGKSAKDKVGRKAKNTPLAAVPIGSPVKVDRKDKNMGVKMEDDLGKRPMNDMPIPMPLIPMEDQMMLAGDLQQLSGLPGSLIDRPKTQAGARPGPSSYWSVSELQDFDKNVAHFGTDWIAIANHMGTKTHTMIKNQYLRLVESGKLDLEQTAKEADARRERGDDLGPPPTPTPAPKRRYESTQAGPIRPIAPTPEHGSPPPNPLVHPKLSPPHSTPSSRFSTIAQAPVQSKPMVPPSGYPTLPETSLASVPSIPPQQSPPAPPQRAPPQHHHQHSMSQHKSQPQGPRAGYFSEDLPPRFESRPPSQPAGNQQAHRPLQQHAPPQPRVQEQHHSPLYRGLHFQERDGAGRPEVQQEQEAQRRFHEHTRRISQEMSQHRPFAAGAAPPIMPPHPQRGPPPMQNAPPPAVTKPAVEPRKSNLMSLLNDTDPEEPRRKKPIEQGPPSHTSTPLQSTPIAPPPTTQSYSSSSRRPLYEDSMAAQSPYTRPASYAQQSSLANATSNRPIDLTEDKPSILQPNPYAQVDPPGSGVPPSGPMGMRPSPHLSTSHIAQQQRDSSGRNDHSQASNANLSYSNPQTPNEHPAHPFQGLSRLTEPYRPRDPREAHDFDPRHSDRDTSRELSQRADYLREQLSNPTLRATGPPVHEDLRYQPQDRGYLSQRSQTPLSRPEHGQPPPLQHPPHSSLGVANHSLYGQRPPEESQHHFMRNPRDRSMTDRIREEQAQAQHQAAMNREEHMRREVEQNSREREMRERDARDAHYRDSIMRGRQDMRGPPPPQPSSGPGSIHDPRPPAGPMDWTNGVRHPQDRGPWQR